MRKIVKNDNATELEKLVVRFGTNNEKVKALKKVTDEDNKEIKKLMVKGKLSEVESGEFVAKYSVAVSEDFNEEKLIAQLKMMGVTDCIKKKEYVDMDILENLIYNGNINGANLAGCKTREEIQKLVVSIKKAKKGEADES